MGVLASKVSAGCSALPWIYSLLFLAPAQAGLPFQEQPRNLNDGKS
jgi:hypothetical protein